MIYLTTYDPQTKLPTGPSVAAGFESLQEVRDLLGPPGGDGKRCITYPDTGLCYSEMEIAR